MRFLIKILIVFFILSQFSTSIICFVDSIDKKNNFVIIDDDDENEKPESNKDSKELKLEFIIGHNESIIFLLKASNNNINTHYFISLNQFNPTIIVPPPKEV